MGWGYPGPLSSPGWVLSSGNLFVCVRLEIKSFGDHTPLKPEERPDRRDMVR